MTPLIFPFASSILRSIPGRLFIFPSQVPSNEDFACTGMDAWARRVFKACKCGDDRHLVGFHVLTLNNKTIESSGFVYGTRDFVVPRRAAMDRDFRTYTAERISAVDEKELGRLLYPLL
jgi:hypothetical protein